LKDVLVQSSSLLDAFATPEMVSAKAVINIRDFIKTPVLLSHKYNRPYTKEL